MSLKPSEPLDPEEWKRTLPPARRRRRRRSIIPGAHSERAAYIDDMARAAVPPFDFFLFSLVAGVLTGRTQRIIKATLPGGDLELEWNDDNHVYMTGPAVEVFTGDWPVA